MTSVLVDDPATGETVVECETLPSSELPELTASATTAGRELASWTVGERVDLCERALGVFKERSDEIGRGITRQMGKPLAESRREVATMATRARYMMELAEQQLGRRELGAGPGLERLLERVPVGVVLDIAAWNYPLLVPVNIVFPAVLAGNAVILKHSSRTPLCGGYFEDAFSQAGAPPGSVTAMVADHETTARLIARPEIGYVAFTGSVTGGREVSRAAAGRFIDVGLELGGKDAAYVRADADLAGAVRGIAEGAFYNAGQSCCAVERIYVDRAIYVDFVDAITEEALRWQAGDPLADATMLGPMALPDAPGLVSRQVEEAVAGGARLLAGGEQEKLGGKGRWFQATVVADADHACSLMTDESFAPVAAVAPVSSDEEAVALMNDSRYGLTASVWTRDREAALSVATQLEVGTVLINCCDHLDPALPWAGWKDSGVGLTMSSLGFERMVRTRGVHMRMG